MPPELPAAIRRHRRVQGLSQGALAVRIGWSRSLVAMWETGATAPDEQQIRALDRALHAHGELIALAQLDALDTAHTTPTATADLLARLSVSDATRATLEQLEAVTHELCCRYPHTPAPQLHAETQTVLVQAAALLRHPIGLRQHQEVLVHTGQLALLAACLEYDQGHARAAHNTRRAARDIAHEAGHGEIAAWASEIGAWIALTAGNLDSVTREVQRGLAAAPNGYGAVQLHAQAAKALARTGNSDGVRHHLDTGRAILDAQPIPERLDHHFVVDPAKHRFYEMDVHRRAGNDVQAVATAHEVLRLGTNPDGTETAPMRMTEARLTLAVAAARQGDLEGAHAYGTSALATARRSLPSLLMVAAELEAELHARFPGVALTNDLSERLRQAHQGDARLGTPCGRTHEPRPEWPITST